jgi:hypothetical protein
LKTKTFRTGILFLVLFICTSIVCLAQTYISSPSSAETYVNYGEGVTISGYDDSHDGQYPPNPLQISIIEVWQYDIDQMEMLIFTRGLKSGRDILTPRDSLLPTL